MGEEVQMFQHSFYQNYEDIFEQGKAPKILKLSNISESQKEWSHTHHMHTETELIYVAKGASMFGIDGVQYERKDGDIIVIEKGTLHSLQSHSGVIWSCTVGEFKIKDMQENTILKPGTKPLINAGKNKQYIENIILTLNALKSEKDNTSIFACHTLAALLVAIYYESFKQSDIIGTQKPDMFIKNILRFLNENYMQSLTLEDIAEKFHVSVSYLSHEFSKEYNISPINYIIERRISEARILLASTDCTVTEIADKVGYGDVSHFTKIFTKKTGVTPKDYSKK